MPGPTTADRDWLESITPEWERFLGPRSAGIAGRILEIYYWHRVPITIHVDRIVAYRHGSSREVILRPCPAAPAS